MSQLVTCKTEIQRAYHLVILLIIICSNRFWYTVCYPDDRSKITSKHVAFVAPEMDMV